MIAEIENEIIRKIVNGESIDSIKTYYNINYKRLYKLSKKFNILDEFKEKNFISLRNKQKKDKCDRYTTINKSIDEKHGNLLRELIIDKKCGFEHIKRITGIPTKRLIRYLEFSNLRNVCIQNGLYNSREIAKINGKKSALKLKGIPIKCITPEIIVRFEELKTQLVYKERVYRKLKEEFNFGEKKCKQLCEKYGYPKDNPQTGNLNPMYGKSPSKLAGIGVKCHFYHAGAVYFCRSLLELKIFLYLADNNIRFQLSKHRVKYTLNNVERTYCPDIIINDIEICEIKPTPLVNRPENILKLEALKKYCDEYKLKCRVITEKDFSLHKYENIRYIENLIEEKRLIIDSPNLEKLKRNIKI